MHVRCFDQIHYLCYSFLSSPFNHFNGFHSSIFFSFKHFYLFNHFRTWPPGVPKAHSATRNPAGLFEKVRSKSSHRQYIKENSSKTEKISNQKFPENFNSSTHMIKESYMKTFVFIVFHIFLLKYQKSTLLVS